MCVQLVKFSQTLKITVLFTFRNIICNNSIHSLSLSHKKCLSTILGASVFLQLDSWQCKKKKEDGPYVALIICKTA